MTLHTFNARRRFSDTFTTDMARDKNACDTLTMCFRVVDFDGVFTVKI